AKVSLDCLTNFLHETELLDEYMVADHKDSILSIASSPDGDIIGFKDASFTWSFRSNPEEHTPSSKPFILCIEGELLFKRGSINLILGPTGLGKTSILMALLGEMHYIPVSPSSWFNLPRAGGIAYAVQESWVQNEKIRCGLKRDLGLFAAGDQTEVGEKGLTLSGGQKARVTLARAVYSSADILLLDDVLAALDVHTATWIVDKCFKGDLIQGQTVLLVAHNVPLTKPIANYVVSLGLDGQIASHGTLLSENTALSREVETLQAEEAEGKAVVVDKDEEIVDRTSQGKLILEEDVAEGHVTWSAMMLFWESLGGPFFWLVFIGGLFLSDILGTMQSWFLGYWTEQYNQRPAPDVNAPIYLGVYGLLIIRFVIVYTTAYMTYVFGTIRAAKVIHTKLIQSILGTTLRWLDTTPTSRVVTRCTQDMNAVDDDVSAYFSFAVELSIKVLVKVTAICMITLAFIGPTFLVVSLRAWCGRIYMAAELNIKREMSVAKAPVLGHFGAAIAGLTSIRAYGAQRLFREQSYRHIDRYTKAARTFYNLNRCGRDW
ncbi:ABC transporter type 1, transmembrane domain-containing protein, partial [Amylostereum chailletii]